MISLNHDCIAVRLAERAEGELMGSFDASDRRRGDIALGSGRGGESSWLVAGHLVGPSQRTEELLGQSQRTEEGSLHVA
jgi:hypothetical protein